MGFPPPSTGPCRLVADVLMETCVYCGEDIYQDWGDDLWFTEYFGSTCTNRGGGLHHQPYDPDPPDMSGSTEGDR